MKIFTKHLKYAFLLALFSGGTVQAQYQLPNAGFEDWEDQTIDDIPKRGGTKSNTATEPVSWNGFGTAKASSTTTALAISNAQLVKEEVEKRSGSFSAKIVSRDVIIAVANGTLTTGRIYAGDITPSNSANHNATVLDDSKFSSSFAGLPDTLTVWVKYVPAKETPKKGENFSRVSAILHDNTSVQDPGTDNSHVIGTAALNYPAVKDENGYIWQRLAIPFDYNKESYTSEAEKPSYALVTFTTNKTPGEGSPNDVVYIDDIEMIYNSQLDSIKCNGVKLSGFDKNKAEYFVTGTYTEGCLSAFADGKGSKVTVTYDEKTQTATIRVEGNDIQDNATNYHEYTVTFCPSQLTDLYFNGKPLAGFSTDKYEYEVSGTYVPYSICSFTKNVSINVPGEYDATTSTLTLLVEGKNIDDDATNYHEYKVKFTPASASTEERTQLMNSDFENWEDVSGFGVDMLTGSTAQIPGREPIGWNSFLTAGGALAPFSAAEKVVTSSDVRPNSEGTKSVKIFSNLALGTIVANGNMTTGRINAGGFSPTDASGNYNVTSVYDPDFSSRFTGTPDSLTVWVKYIPNDKDEKKGPYMARVNAVLHDAYAYQDPIPDALSEAMASHKVASAETNYPSTEGAWKKLSIPFQYTDNGSKPAYALVSFTTNMTPGNGSAMDTVYVDDMEMIYNSQLDSIKCNGVKLSGFDKNKAEYFVTGTYTEGCLSAFADGKGSKVTVTYDEKTQTATIRVEGNDIQDNATNYHEYTVTFCPSQLTDLYFNGKPLAGFSTDKYEYEVSGTYVPYSICSFTKNVSINVPGEYDATTSTLTLLVEGKNIDDDATNYHEYKVKFTPASASTEERTQLMNSDFENWEDVSGFGVDMLTGSTAQIPGREPIGWNSFLTAGGALAPFSAAEKVVTSSDVRPNSEGTKSVKIFSNLALGTIVANGNMTTGRINAGGFSPTDASGNYNVTSVYDPDFSSRFTGTPDSLTVWVKYIPNDKDEKKGPYMARVNAVLHDAYAYQDPIPDALSEAMASHKVASAETNYPSTEGAWKKLSIPFQYTDNGSKPAYALVSFTTNMTPGNGSAMDTVYVDDMEMIYNSRLDSIKYNDTKIAGFGKDKSAYEVVGYYTLNCLTAYTDGKGAKTAVTYDESTKTATIRVEGNDIQDNAENYHEYTVLFKNPDGIDDVSSNGAVRLYRIDDATIGLTSVETGEDFCIYSQNGTLVLEGKLEMGIINVKNLNNGVYILKVAGKNITFIR